MALKPDKLPLVSSSHWLHFVRVSCSCLLIVTLSSTSSNASSSRSWNFDADAPNTLPSDFEVGTLFDGRAAGEWKVVQTEKAKIPPHVFGQLQGKGAEHAYKVVLVNGTDSSDLDLNVSFLSISGKADMGGGLIWRAADDRKIAARGRANTRVDLLTRIRKRPRVSTVGTLVTVGCRGLRPVILRPVRVRTVSNLSRTVLVKAGDFRGLNECAYRGDYDRTRRGRGCVAQHDGKTARRRLC